MAGDAVAERRKLDDRLDWDERSMAEGRPGSRWLLARVLPEVHGGRTEVTYEATRAEVDCGTWALATGMSATFLGLLYLPSLVSPVLRLPLYRLPSAGVSDEPSWWAVALISSVQVGAMFWFFSGLRRRRRSTERFTWRSLLPSALSRRLFELALHETRVWREGAEDWTVRQRRRVVAAFVSIQAAGLFLSPAFLLAAAVFVASLMGYYMRQVSRHDRGRALRRLVGLHWAYYVVSPAVTLAVLPLVVWAHWDRIGPALDRLHGLV